MTAKIQQLKITDLIYPIAAEMQDKIVTRVFDKGIDGNNSQIGKYSTDPNYFTKDKFHNTGVFKPQGKTGKGKKKNGGERKSMYLIGGYKQLRQIQGDESGFVNLTYTAQLRKDFATGLKIDGNTVVISLKQNINSQKVDWLTDKYGNETFKHTKEERKFFAEETQKALIKYFNA